MRLLAPAGSVTNDPAPQSFITEHKKTGALL